MGTPGINDDPAAVLRLVNAENERIERERKIRALRARVNAPYERKAVWDRWGDGVNLTLHQIDNWWGKYESKMPLHASESLKALLIELSGRIAACPGKPGNETFVLPPEEDFLTSKTTKADWPPVGFKEVYPPVYAVGDEAVQRIEATMRERAMQRRAGTSFNWYFLVTIILLLASASVVGFAGETIWRFITGQ